MIDFSGLHSRTLQVRRRSFAVGTLILLLDGALIAKLLQGLSPLTLIESQALLPLLVLIIVGVIARLAQLSIARPHALEVKPTGIRLYYRSLGPKDLDWLQWGSQARLYHVTRASSSLPLGDEVRLARPVPHTFWITEEGTDAILRGARVAGLVETSQEWRRLFLSGWATIGRKISFQRP